MENNKKLTPTQVIFGKYLLDSSQKIIYYPFFRSIQLLQVNTTSFQGISDTFKNIFQKEGLSSFYRGMPLQLLYKAAFLPINFLQLQRKQNEKEQSFYLNMAWNITAFAFVHPLLVTQIHYATDIAPSKDQRRYLGIVDCVKKLYNKGGIPQLYKGLLFSLVFQSINTFLFQMKFAMLNKGKNSGISQETMTNQVQIYDTISFFLTYPLLVTNLNFILSGTPSTDLMKEIPKFKGIIECGKWIYKTNGLKGFYRGAIPYFVVFHLFSIFSLK